jgi:hypothetical protein
MGDGWTKGAAMMNLMRQVVSALDAAFIVRWDQSETVCKRGNW